MVCSCSSVFRRSDFYFLQRRNLTKVSDEIIPRIKLKKKQLATGNNIVQSKRKQHSKGMEGSLCLANFLLNI